MPQGEALAHLPGYLDGLSGPQTLPPHLYGNRDCTPVEPLQDVQSIKGVRTTTKFRGHARRLLYQGNLSHGKLVDQHPCDDLGRIITVIMKVMILKVTIISLIPERHNSPLGDQTHA